ncbi:diguanylate cyclase [Azotosporobacter soli]|uniref:diguanylate cyclase n=1 Tax=Azotosporobacter soli TaxID=3055040 RepID=UPI0031FF4703
MEKMFLEMIDLAELKDLMEAFFDVTAIPCAILDMDGKILIGIGWQSLCVQFHRKNPATLERCCASDRALLSLGPGGKRYHYHVCLNGLVDVASPLFVGGMQVGSIMLGQFFFEEPDIEWFKRQAHLYGFLEAEYLSALKAVPVFSKDKVDKVMKYYVKFGEILGNLAAERMRFLELQKMSATDGLTGIANRRCFDAFFEQSLRTAGRKREPISLMMLDVDWFKQYNDSQGHLYGDDCLKVISSVLMREMKRSEDFAARYGGEEFAVVMPNTDEEGALLVAQRVKDKIAALKLEHPSSPYEFVTVSIGVVSTQVDPLTKSFLLIDKADKALYAAKQNGRNRIECCSN